MPSLIIFDRSMLGGIVFFGGIIFWMSLWYFMYRKAEDSNSSVEIDNMLEHENQMLRKRMLKNKHERVIRKTLETHFEYYQQLNSSEKERFFRKVSFLIRSKRIRGVKGLEITMVHRTLICACITQVTFGIPNARMSHLRTIILHPDVFQSYYSRHKMKGSYNVNGVLNLSWKDFIDGYEDPNDCYNVGIHEVAHALQLGSLTGYIQDDFFSVYHNKWELLSKRLLSKRREGELSFLRSYSKTNDKEFFAVVVEHFFEQPQELKDETPGMYYHLCVLLNQNPLKLGEGYPRLELAREHQNVVFQGEPIASFESKKYNVNLIAILAFTFIGLLVLGNIASTGGTVFLLVPTVFSLLYMRRINKKLHHVDLFKDGVRIRSSDIQKMPLNYSYKQLVGLYRSKDWSIKFDCVSTEDGALVDIPVYLNVNKIRLVGLRKILKEQNVVLAGVRL